ncbi:hypothetical protein [Kocuria sabuli]
MDWTDDQITEMRVGRPVLRLLAGRAGRKGIDRMPEEKYYWRG